MSTFLGSTRWVVMHLLRHPLSWLWISVSAAAWPTITFLTPRGLIGGSSLEQGLHYEVAFVGLILGAVVGSTLLERGEWFLAGRSDLGRLGLELGGLAVTSTLLVLPGFLAPWMAGPRELGTLPARLVLCHLHLSGLTLVLLRLGLSSSLRTGALLTAVWLLPALLDPETFAGRMVGSSLAAGQLLVPDTESVLGTPLWKERLAPIIGLLGAAFLLRPPLLLHALRHPR